MTVDHIRYDLLAQEALRSVVRRVLSDAARDGLPGDHHFYVSFDTRAPGVRLSQRMREKYPEDVTEKAIELNAAPATRRHMLDFLSAVDRRGRPVADIEEGHISTASCILANVSMQLGRSLVYDPKKQVVAGDREATRLLRRAYREPWQHPMALRA